MTTGIRSCRRCWAASIKWEELSARIGCASGRVVAGDTVVPARDAAVVAPVPPHTRRELIGTLEVPDGTRVSMLEWMRTLVVKLSGVGRARPWTAPHQLRHSALQHLAADGS